jgi:hypothetical protein
MKNKQTSLYHSVRVEHDTRALVYRNRKLVRVLKEGRVRYLDFNREHRVVLADRRDVRLHAPDLRQVAESGLLDDEIRVLDIQERERALVRLDGRLSEILGPGLHLLWTGPQKLEVEVLGTDGLLLRHPELDAILRLPGQGAQLESWEVPEGSKGVLYVNGKLESVLPPGRHAAWKGRETVRLYAIDCREKPLEISGQDIMTSDRVTLRLNVSLVVCVRDAALAVRNSVNAEEAIYREAQLAVRAEIGGRSLDELLAEKAEARGRAPGAFAGAGEVSGTGNPASRSAGRDPARRDEGDPQPGDPGRQEGGSQRHSPSRGNRRHAFAVEHRPADPGQPHAHASARAGSDRAHRRKRKAQRDAG